MENDPPPFRLRPPSRYPDDLIVPLRRSLNAGSGWVSRLWVTEMYFTGDEEARPPRLALAAELRGHGGPELDPEIGDEAGRDLQRRLHEDVEGIEPDSVSIFLFTLRSDSDVAQHLRGQEPVFGPAYGRVLDVDKFAKLRDAPRKLPTPRKFDDKQLAGAELWGVLGLFLGVGVGLAALAWWLIPWTVVAWIAIAVILLATAVLVVLTYQDSVLGSVRKRGELRSLPLTLASVVQAHEALWEPESSGYPEGARFGLVAVFSLDPKRRDDPAWLGWMARRLGHLRETPSRDPDETRITQRLESEADDGTSRIPTSIAGNDATYWVSPHYRGAMLPGNRLPGDGLLPILLEPDAAPGAEAVRMRREWPLSLWPMLREPVPVPVEKPKEPEAADVDPSAPSGSASSTLPAD